jgi:crossover junction endodeoxyribonuclease RuvC
MPSIPKSERCYLGVDPGKSGGFAIIQGTKLVQYQPMPDSDLDLFHYVRDVTKQFEDLTGVIERVHSMPGEGHVGVFSFGENYGKLQMAVTANHIPYEKITPRTWQKGIGVQAKDKKESKPQFKERLRQLAQQLFPYLELWNRPRSLGLQRSVCDAMLIAEFCRRKSEGIVQ